MIFCIAATAPPKDHGIAARDRLNQAGVKIFGIVLNRYDSTQKGSRQRYYYYYQYYQSRKEADSAA